MSLRSHTFMDWSQRSGWNVSLSSSMLFPSTTVCTRKWEVEGEKRRGTDKQSFIRPAHVLRTTICPSIKTKCTRTYCVNELVSKERLLDGINREAVTTWWSRIQKRSVLDHQAWCHPDLLDNWWSGHTKYRKRRKSRTICPKVTECKRTVLACMLIQE
jgi:hypothetical protein